MRMIFHHPLPIDYNSRVASGIRPVRMINAFKELGYTVDVVAGHGAERKKAVVKIKSNIKNGVKYSFVYAENSTLPVVLTEPHRIPLYPFLDYRFFKFCNKNNIPIGVFYRDIYWLFENFNNRLGGLKSLLASYAYRYELWVYNKTVSKFYLPSLEMGKYVPIVHKSLFESLPPGHLNQDNSPLTEYNGDILKLFYVGGMSDHYQMHKLFETVRVMPQVELTVCTRESEWLSVKSEYPELTENIKIIHKVGKEMEHHLQDCDIALLFVKPQEYREFAAPVKLYEYLGFHKPMIASSGTLAGSFIKENSIGWVVDYDEIALNKLLESLQEKPRYILDARASLGKVKKLHLWKSRAEKVVKDLMN